MTIRLLFIVFLYSIGSIAQENPTVTVPDSKTINEWLSSSQVPTMAIATIENGALNAIQIESILEKKPPVTSKTVFDVASLTKTITTLLTLQLVQNGSWDLDEPVFQYWVDPDVQNDSLHKKLTTRHILSHRTGFVNWRRMHESKKLTFDFEPGSKFQYSGEGFEYLRKALENKFKISFEKLSDSLVFTPNKMTNSSLIWNKKIDSLGFAGTYDKSGNPYEYDKSFSANAADNLLTTVEDMGKLGVNIIKQQHLTPSVYNTMITKHSLVRDGIHFGLGWIVFDNLPNNEYALFNAGSDKGVNALILLLPNSKRGLVMITNGDNGRSLVMKSIGTLLGDTGKEILSRF